MSEWNDPEIKNIFLNSTPLIDVRAPIEYEDGSIPNSVNLPIMINSEREQVGTCYKVNGQAAAIKLGHELISGEVKESRISAWKNYITEHPKTEVFCFRGGLRSQISCQWLKEAGIERVPITGGYKRMRRFFLSQINDKPLPGIVRLGGYTGSGKTKVLEQIHNSIDLERLASHRGSAFGENGIQPGQIRFENELGLELLKKAEKMIIVEDESSMIGKLRIPQRLYLSMGESSIIILKTDIETRVSTIFDEYVENTDFLSLSSCLQRISKSLGGQLYKEISSEMNLAFRKDKSVNNHEAWIMMLLKSYYDPLYEKAIRRQAGKVIFEGSQKEVIDFSNKFLRSAESAI